ncbi:hypothetical protein FBU59_005101, partial [Linderina macrospora]
MTSTLSSSTRLSRRRLCTRWRSLVLTSTRSTPRAAPSPSAILWAALVHARSRPCSLSSSARTSVSAAPPCALAVVSVWLLSSSRST